MTANIALAGIPTNLTASGLVASAPGIVLGVIINSANATGSFQLLDGITSGAAARMGALIPGNGVSGIFIPCYFEMQTGCYCTIAATINLTVIFATYGSPRAVPTAPPQA